MEMGGCGEIAKPSVALGHFSFSYAKICKKAFAYSRVIGA